MKSESNSYLSITQLVTRLNRLLADNAGNLFFQGEISSFKVYSSGHAYFDIKDQNSVVSCIMWRSTVGRLKFKPKPGQAVLCQGSPNIYAPSGQLKVIVSKLELDGEGDLQEKFLALKSQLATEGLFDEARKRALPFLPKSIGIITSSSGAVIHDMQVTLARRNKNIKVYLYGAKVQGEGSVDEMIAGLQYFNQEKSVDLIILARGGGSLEDLWSFNEEALVREVFASKIPVVSGVGHEPDVTLVDLAADLRAATPTAAAELAVPEYDALMACINDYERRLGNLEHFLGAYIYQFDTLVERFKRSVNYNQQSKTARLESAEQSLRFIKPDNLIKNLKFKVSSLEKHLLAISPQKVLDRGFSLVKKDGVLVQDANTLSPDDLLELQFAKGTANAIVSSANE